MSRSSHAWTVTRAEWPYRYFPAFAIGTAHGERWSKSANKTNRDGSRS